MQLTYTNAGFYNPVPPPPSTESSSFPNNGFSSFLGANMPFNIEVGCISKLFSMHINVVRFLGIRKEYQRSIIQH